MVTRALCRLVCLQVFCLACLSRSWAAEELYPKPIDLNVLHVSTDKSVKYDIPIVYVCSPRQGDDVGSKWPEIPHSVQLDAGADLMLRQPNGSEEVLVA